MYLKPSDRVTPALRELHWFPVGERIHYTSCACWFTSRLWDTRRSEYISDLLTSVANIPVCTTRFLRVATVVVPRIRRQIGDNAFSVAALRAWNRLPTELNLLQSTESFRRDLRTQFDSGIRPRSSSRWRNTSDVPHSYSYS